MDNGGKRRVFYARQRRTRHLNNGIEVDELDTRFEKEAVAEVKQRLRPPTLPRRSQRFFLKPHISHLTIESVQLKREEQ